MSILMKDECRRGIKPHLQALLLVLDNALYQFTVTLNWRLEESIRYSYNLHLFKPPVDQMVSYQWVFVGAKTVLIVLSKHLSGLNSRITGDRTEHPIY